MGGGKDQSALTPAFPLHFLQRKWREKALSSQESGGGKQESSKHFDPYLPPPLSWEEGYFELEKGGGNLIRGGILYMEKHGICSSSVCPPLQIALAYRY